MWPIEKNEYMSKEAKDQETASAQFVMSKFKELVLPGEAK